MPAFAAQIAAIERGEREPVLRVGNLDARRDFLDVRDVVEAYLLAATAPSLPRGVVLNVASGEPRRIGDVLDALLVMSRVAIRVERDPALMRPSDVPVTAGNAARARTLLSWRPAHLLGRRRSVTSSMTIAGAAETERAVRTRLVSSWRCAPSTRAGGASSSCASASATETRSSARSRITGSRWRCCPTIPSAGKRCSCANSDLRRSWPPA